MKRSFQSPKFLKKNDQKKGNADKEKKKNYNLIE